jgi:hypothetical protein
MRVAENARLNDGGPRVNLGKGVSARRAYWIRRCDLDVYIVELFSFGVLAIPFILTCKGAG